MPKRTYAFQPAKSQIEHALTIQVKRTYASPYHHEATYLLSML